MEQRALKRYLLKVWYVGTDFVGSQRQVGNRTVEGELLYALKKAKLIVDMETCNFKAGNRTDAGVSAKEAAFCFDSVMEFYPGLLDSKFPPDMGLVGWAEVCMNFNPRWECLSKEYYYILPIIEGSNLNLPLIQQGMDIMLGSHDFKQFSKTDRSKRGRLTVLTLDKATVSQQDNQIFFHFQAQAFLWQQIRRMVGFLVKLGADEVDLGELERRFQGSDQIDPRIKRDNPMSADGLILWKIHFDPSIIFHEEHRCDRYHAKKLTQVVQLRKQQALIAEMLRSTKSP